ncbi:MAG: hypothetical protein ACT4PX_07655, partial [Actinomycetota bacterium]
FLTRSEAEARLVVAMAGRAAEELHLEGDFTQGAASDFASATSLALAMVTEYGMSDLGPTSRATYTHLGSGQADRIGEAVDAILDQALTSARQLIAANIPLLESLVADLLADETVNGHQLSTLVARHGAVAPSPAYAAERHAG